MLSRRSALLSCTVAVVFLTGCARSESEADRRAEIQHLLDTYLQSVKTADVALASTVWLHSPEVVVVTPLGRLQGWDSVQRDLYVNFLQKSFLERDLRPASIHIQVNGNSAWAIFDWSFTGKLANGQLLTSKGWESHVYEKTGDGWRIAHLHYSGQPAQSQ